MRNLARVECSRNSGEGSGPDRKIMRGANLVATVADATIRQHRFHKRYGILGYAEFILYNYLLGFRQEKHI